MLQTIPWSTYTWRNVADGFDRSNEDKALRKRARKLLKWAKKLGIADEPLPETYGLQLLPKKERKRAKKLLKRMEKING